MKWISGRETVEEKFQGKTSRLIDRVWQGTLTPYLLSEPMTWSDPDEHQGAHRLLPTRLDRSKYDTLQWMRFRRAKLKEWLNQSDDQIKEYDEWMERTPIRDPGQRRAIKQKELADVNREIEKLENELEPAKVWGILKQSDLTPAKEEELKALLLASYYLTEEVERIDRNGKASQKPRKQNARTAAALAKFIAYARIEYGRGRTLDAIADDPEVNAIFKENNLSTPAYSTLRKHLQGIGTPGAPRKK